MVSIPPAALVPVSSERVSLTGASGARLAGERFAPASALQSDPALIYTHGFGQTRHAWSRTARLLAARGYPGISYDARGHGDSQRNAERTPYEGEQFADDLIIVAGAQPQAPVLIGASMGGLFGLMAESRWPGLFSAMVLVDITPRWESAGLQRILGFMTAFPDGFDSLQHASDSIAAYLPHRKTRKSPEELGELLRRGDDGRWRWHWDPRLIDELARDSEQHQDAIADAASRVRCPVLLISGGRSDLVSERTVEEFRTRVPHADHVHLPEATHMVAGDDNDTFTTTVLEYLAELRSDSSLFMPDPTEPSAAGGTATGVRP